MLRGPFPRTGLVRGVSDGGLELDPAASVRESTMSRILAAGARIVRIPVSWRAVAPSQPPAGFDPADPAAAAYRFGPVDAAVRSASAAGLTPLLVVSQAPAFAEAAPGWPYAYPGSWDPSPEAFASFATAIARRYDGRFGDPLEPGLTLPRVRLFQAWNEPNLARYLEPQWIAAGGRWTPFSPLVYRRLLNAFYGAVKAVQPGAVVATAGLAPNGDPAGVARMAPLSFLEGLLCVPPPHAPRPPCPEPAHLDALAFHPLSFGSPDGAAGSSLDVGIADAGKIGRVLARARRLGTVLPAGRKPLWATELNWESAPQAAAGVPPSEQAAWISRALHRLWAAGVGLVDWEFLIDPFPALRLGTPSGGTIEVQRPAGLYAAGPGGDPLLASPKPFLEGFTLPFDPIRVDRRRVRAWALLARPGEPAVLERLARSGAWVTVARVRANRAAVLNALVPLRGPALLRLTAGATASAAAAVPRGRTPL
jgi:hypothetical protein